MNQFVSAANFLYYVTLETLWPEGALPRPRVSYKLPVVLSPAEVDAFFRHVGTLRCRAALMTAYGAGLTVPFRGLSLRVSEVVRMKVSDIDSARMLIRVEQGKGKKDRYAMLSPPSVESAAGLVVHRTPAGLAVSRPPPRPPHECRRSPAGLPAGG